jgi:hypothetical protein
VKNNAGSGVSRSQCYVDPAARVEACAGDENLMGDGALANHVKGFPP